MPVGILGILIFNLYNLVSYVLVLVSKLMSGEMKQFACNITAVTIRAKISTQVCTS